MEENIEDIIAASQALVRQSAKKAKVQARADSVAHLRKLMDKPDSRDVEFICQDGVKVKACRMFLAGRSPVFDSILTNGMLESTSSVINLPEIPALALKAILEYLYTSAIVDYEPKDWKSGLEIMSAVRFFLLPTIDKIVEDFNMAHITSVGKDFQQAATMLSVAMSFKCLSHDESQTFKQLASLLKSIWMHSEYACHLSEEAVEFILKHTKSEMQYPYQGRSNASLEEYFRFRGVILWCMYNSRSACIKEVDKLVNEAIPFARKDLYVKGTTDLSTMKV